MLRAVRLSPSNPRTWSVRWHLLRCSVCRRRIVKAEAELFRLFAPIERAADALAPSGDESRRRLVSSMRTAALPKPLALHASEFPSRTALISAGLLAVGVLVAFLFVASARRPAMTVDAALSRSVATEEIPRPELPPGVIFQRISLRTSGKHSSQQFEWPVYRDRQGKRKPRFQLASQPQAVQAEIAMTERLAAAGVLRENPLSADSFRTWRDHFRGHSDSIVYSPSGIITVTTSLSTDSPSQVREETLTLRGQDFHPLSRTVSFRDDETVEIAELDYRVLDWDNADRAWFEDPAQPLRHVDARPQIAAPVEPPALSEAQLILAELDARMVLSRTNADSDEQIELIRGRDGVVVQGLVSSAERKQQLQAALAAMPHVKAQISTPAERAAAEPESTGTPAQSVRLSESVSHPSPLLLYWQSHHENPQEMPRTAWQVLDSGLRIRQQSHALRELAHEFSTGTALDEPARQAYEALWNDHVQKLRAALADQDRILRQLAPSLPAHAAALAASEAAPTADDLDTLASTSLGLCRELTAGEDSSQRDALAILVDLSGQASAISAELDRLTAQKTAQTR